MIIIKRYLYCVYMEYILVLDIYYDCVVYMEQYILYIKEKYDVLRF